MWVHIAKNNLCPRVLAKKEDKKEVKDMKAEIERNM